MRKLLFFIFPVLLVAGISAQENKSSPTDSWIRIESSKKDFSVAFPPNSIVDAEDGEYRLYNYFKGNRFYISMENKPKANEEFTKGLSYIKDKNKYEFFKGEDFVGMQYKGEKTDDDYFYLWLSLASSKGKYTVSVYSKNPSDVDYARILYSIHLNGKPLFAQNDSTAVTDAKLVSVSSFQTDALVLNALKQKDSEQAKLPKEKVEENKEKDLNDYSRQLIVIKKPRAAYTDSARRNGVQGKVKLKVTFLAIGQIGDIALISSPDNSLAKQAFAAAKKVKFLPAEINGKPVDVTRTMEYSFTIY